MTEPGSYQQETDTDFVVVLRTDIVNLVRNHIQTNGGNPNNNALIAGAICAAINDLCNQWPKLGDMTIYGLTRMKKEGLLP